MFVLSYYIFFTFAYIVFTYIHTIFLCYKNEAFQTRHRRILNESLEFDSDTTELYDSDVDPEYLPKVINKTISTGNNDNIISADSSRTLSLSSSSSYDESASEVQVIVVMMMN